MKSDGGKIFDSLESVLAKASDEQKIPVLIMAKSESELPQIEKAAGDLEIRFRYKIVPAVAALATPAQIKALARQSCVQHIEHDAEVTVLLDGANRWFGTAQARADFGVTGDRDGNATGYSKNDVVVAVIDTGIDAAHSDLNGGKVIGWNDFVNSRTTPYDDHGHGTHVSGIVAGTGAGNAAYMGVAPGAALVGLKVLNSSGSGSLSTVAAAVDWAVANKDTYGIKVISIDLPEVLRLVRPIIWLWETTQRTQGGAHRKGSPLRRLAL